MSPEPNVKLGSAIRAKRIVLGLSQDALGKRIGVAGQQMQKYEKGTNSVTFPRLVEIAGALGTTADQLVVAALGKGSASREGYSDRETLELLKRLADMTPNQRRGVQLLVQKLAETD